MKSEEFIREVDEELQWERLAKLWQRFGPYVIGLAVLVVLGTAGKVGYETWYDKRIQDQARIFAAAERLVAEDPVAAAEKWLELARDGDDGFAALARLRAAAAFDDAGNRDRALAALREAASGAEDPLVRDLATLFLAQYRIDEDDPGALVADLEPLTAADRPFRHSARELLAIASLRAGDRERARTLLKEILDDATTPLGQQRRVREMYDALGGSGEDVSS